ncbi:MAG: cell division protein FtsA [Chloroflexi bacterium]|jgi:cell division protein FtsA|nr:cell division protein FtsA [Chloroflexota bacterium]
MEEETIVVGLDVGTSKVCTLVARVENGANLRILGVGIEPTQGLRKGTVTDINAASESIARSIEKAERTSGFEINSAIVNLAGTQVSSTISKGAVGISGRVIDQEDVYRALDSAQAIAVPHNREIVHVIQRGFNIDGQEDISQPVGMHGYRMEVEAHIITSAASTMENMRQCVSMAGIDVTQFVLNPLAASEAILSETEREMGAAVVDLGAGTTGVAIYIKGDVFHANVLSVGGNYITSDIAQGLRLPLDIAEEVKLHHGYALLDDIAEDDYFNIVAFGSEQSTKVARTELVNIIEARAEEIMMMVQKEIKRSGYDSMLPAGVVLTGGGAQLPGMRDLATKILNLPVRVAKPEKMVGLTDQISSPAYATSVGLLNWGILFSETNQIAPERPGKSRQSSSRSKADGLREWLNRLLP